MLNRADKRLKADIYGWPSGQLLKATEYAVEPPSKETELSPKMGNATLQPYPPRCQDNAQMRSLGKPEVLKSAAIAACVTSVVCYPRLCFAPRLAYPIWYLEALLFLGSIVLWAFVFAWYTQYSGQPIITLRMPRTPFIWATSSGLIMASVLRLWLDPVLRARNPDDYPLTVEHWIALTLFSLAFTQLFLVFAPFAWALRLVKRRSLAVVLTVLFGLYVSMVKNYGSPRPISIQLWLGLLSVRLAISLCSALFFIRGGLVLVWWWSFLLQSRHLLAFAHQ